MLELRLRPEAQRDLLEIWAFTRQRWSSSQAERYLAAINAEFERLRPNPRLGISVGKVQAPFRKRACGRHIIFYLLKDEVLDVVRVLHQRMDHAAKLANDEG